MVGNHDIALCLQGLGNTVMFLPVLEKYVRENPGVRLSVVISDNGSHQLARAVVRSPSVTWYAWHERESIARNLARLAWALRKERFRKLYVVFPGGRREEALAALVHADQRWRAGRGGSRLPYSPGRRWLERADGAGLHDIERNASLFGVSLLPSTARLASGRGSHLVIGVHPGSSAAGSSKRWDVEKYRELMARCEGEYDCEWVLFGDSSESHLVERLREGRSPRAHLVVAEPLPSVVERVSACDVFVTNDSALMHIAAVNGVPTLALWPYTDYRRTAPFGHGNLAVRSRLDCNPCFDLHMSFLEDCRYHLQCIRGMGVDQVWEVMRVWIRELRGGIDLSKQSFQGLSGKTSCEELSHGCLVVSLEPNTVEPLHPGRTLQLSWYRNAGKQQATGREESWRERFARSHKRVGTNEKL